MAYKSDDNKKSLPGVPGLKMGFILIVWAFLLSQFTNDMHSTTMSIAVYLAYIAIFIIVLSLIIATVGTAAKLKKSITSSPKQEESSNP